MTQRWQKYADSDDYASFPEFLDFAGKYQNQAYPAGLLVKWLGAIILTVRLHGNFDWIRFRTWVPLCLSRFVSAKRCQDFEIQKMIRELKETDENAAG